VEVSLILGRYQLLKEIAIGGMAEIYVAKQTGVEGFEKLVVIKKILPQFARDPHFIKMFLNEARLAARLTHPNIVHIYDLGYANGVYFIAMEYIHGENLSGVTFACRQQKHAIPLEHALKIVSQICEGLHYAHSKTNVQGKPLGVVHRDVSPQNILISFEGVVKLVDFGVAKAATRYDEDTRAGLIKGKLAYMSPEQISGQPMDSRSDLFSLGIVLWELCTGRRLFGRFEPAVILQKIAEAEVTAPSQANRRVTPPLEAIILRCLQKDPGRRYQSAFQMHMAIEEFMKKQGLSSSTLHLGRFMHTLFKQKLEDDEKIREAEEAGAGLESELFSDLEPTKEAAEGAAAIEELFPTTPPTTGESAVVEVSDEDIVGTPKRRWGVWVFLLLLLLALAVVGYRFHSEILALMAKWTGKEESAGKPEPPLVLARGTVKVDSRPTGASVALDGRSRGKTPGELSDIEVGVEHQLEVSTPGYQPWSIRFTLQKAGEVKALDTTLAKLPEPPGKEPEETPKKEPVALHYGKVHVITRPPGATVELDGAELVDATPVTISAVAVGKRHKLRAFLEGRKDWVVEFRVKKNQRLVLRGRLPPLKKLKKPKKEEPAGDQARLSIDSIPSAQVFVDHVQVGNTPLRNHKIAPGSHVIHLFSQELGKTKEIKIDAKAGPPRPGRDKSRPYIRSTPWPSGSPPGSSCRPLPSPGCPPADVSGVPGLPRPLPR
jgi:serine/threonine-protein kinase